MEILRSALLWFLEIITSEAIAVLLVVGVPMLLAFLRKKYPDWAGVAQAILMGLALSVVILAGSMVILEREAAPATASAENIEDLVQIWVHRFGFGIQKDALQERVYFSYRVTLQSGVGITVHRTERKDNLLEFAAKLSFPDEYKEDYTNMSAEQRELLNDRLRVELAKLHVGVTADIPKGITFNTMIPITAELTELAFAEKLWDLEAAVVLAGSTAHIEFIGNRARSREK